MIRLDKIIANGKESRMKQLLFIYNPHAGKARIAGRLHEVIEVFRAENYLPAVYATTGPRDAVQAARKLASGYGLVVCAGGDGTLSEVISGLLECGYTGELGYLPAGSTNDFSRSLALPTEELAAARTAAVGRAVECDIGRFNERSFVYVAAFGLFTRVSYETPQEFKNIFGHMAYVLAGIRSLAEIDTYHMKIQWDEGELEGEFIYGAVSNSISVGGFRGILSDQVVLDDGLFEVMLVKKPCTLPELNSVVTALLKNQPDEYVMAFQTRRISIQSVDEVPWTLDGENGGRHSVAEITNRTRAVRIRVPEERP